MDKRNHFIDNMKGVAIILVVLGHCIQALSFDGSFWNRTILVVICSFHMPLFMFLSGYVFFYSCTKKSTKQVILSRFRGIAIPMMVWGAVDFLIRFNEIENVSLITCIKKYINCCIEIWFLYAVLVASVIVLIIQKVLGDKPLLKYALMILATFAIGILPFNTYVIFVYPYFVAGFAFNEFLLFKNAKYIKLQPVFVVIWIVLLFFYKREDYIYVSGISPLTSAYGFWNQIFIDIYRYAVGLFGTLAVIYLLKLLYDKFSDSWFFESCLNYVGKHSMDIYVIQRLVIERYFSKFIAAVCPLFIMHNSVVFYVCVLTCAVAGLVIISLLAYVLGKNRLLNLLLFGKISNNKKLVEGGLD